jgi:hypothetical protein
MQKVTNFTLELIKQERPSPNFSRIHTSNSLFITMMRPVIIHDLTSIYAISQNCFIFFLIVILL